MKQEKDKQLRVQEGEKVKRPAGAFELWKHIGATKAKRVVDLNGDATTESLLAIYKDCLTYMFILEGEVASIHYDRMRGEIFFKGHNIQNMDLTPSQINGLKNLMVILAQDNEGKIFLSDYSATLDKLLADKK